MQTSKFRVCILKKRFSYKTKKCVCKHVRKRQCFRQTCRLIWNPRYGAVSRMFRKDMSPECVALHSQQNHSLEALRSFHFCNCSRAPHVTTVTAGYGVRKKRPCGGAAFGRATPSPRGLAPKRTTPCARLPTSALSWISIASEHAFFATAYKCLKRAWI